MKIINRIDIDTCADQPCLDNGDDDFITTQEIIQMTVLTWNVFDDKGRKPQAVDLNGRVGIPGWIHLSPQIMTA
jgi:hypothetical protein